MRFLTMELVEGQTPRPQLVARAACRWRACSSSAIALADALVAAHERGVVHRDLKPGERDGHARRAGEGARLRAGASSRRGRARVDATQAATVAAPLSSAGQVWAPCPTWRPSRCAARRWTRAPTCSPSASCSTSWPPGGGRSPGDSRADVSSAILRDAPEPLTQRARRPAGRPRAHRRAAAWRRTRASAFQTALDVRNELRRLQRALETRRAAPRSRPPTQVASIAVLPFVNRSASADDEYFSDGLADELLNVLAKIRGLRVAARTSSFQFKGKSDDLADDRPEAERRHRARGQRAQGGQPRAHLGAARRTSPTAPTCGPRPTTARSRTSSRCRTTSRSRW